MKLLRSYPFPTWRISSLRTEGKGGTEGVKTSTGKKEPSDTNKCLSPSQRDPAGDPAPTAGA